MARAIAEGLRGRDGDAREVKVTRGATPEAHVTLAATVPDRCALRRWLLGFGAAIEVLGPEPLRAEFRAKARDLAERYGEHAGCTGSRA